MQKIRNYIARFFKGKKIKGKDRLTTNDMTLFATEIKTTNIEGLFYTISTLFDYGFVKGYRACQSEMKKRGAVHE